MSSPQISEPKYVRYLFRKSEPDPTISLVNSAGLPASSFMTDEFKPPREPITPRTPKREPSEAELAQRRATRLAKRAEQQNSSSKPSPGKAMKTDAAGALTESNGLAPEVMDLSSEDISFAKEKNLPDLNARFSTRHLRTWQTESKLANLEAIAETNGDSGISSRDRRGTAR